MKVDPGWWVSPSLGSTPRGMWPGMVTAPCCWEWAGPREKEDIGHSTSSSCLPVDHTFTVDGWWV